MSTPIDTPMLLIKKAKSKYPQAFKMFEDFYKESCNSENSKYYLPTSVFITHARFFSKTKNELDIVKEAWLLQVTSCWRRNKIVFDFDDELVDNLLKCSMSDVPVQALDKVPYPCFFVNLKKQIAIGKHIFSIQGFFVLFEHDRDYYDYPELRIILVTDDEQLWNLNLPLIADESIDNIIMRSMQKDFVRIGVVQPKSEIEETAEIKSELMKSLLPLILYLCANNSIVKEDDEQKKIYRKPASFEAIKDRYKEIRKWNVGYRYKQSNQSHNHYSGVGTGTGSAKRPHIRKGHFHSYWIGKSNEKELIVKWIDMTTVNMISGDDIIPTVVKIKQNDSGLEKK